MRRAHPQLRRAHHELKRQKVTRRQEITRRRRVTLKSVRAVAQVLWSQKSPRIRTKIRMVR